MQMGGKLNSLTDVLKKTLFFFEALSVAELIAPCTKKNVEGLFLVTGRGKGWSMPESKPMFL